MRAAQTVTTMNDDAMMDMHVSQIGADGTPSNMWLFRGSLPTEIYSFSDMHGTADGQLALAFNFKGYCPRVLFISRDEHRNTTAYGTARNHLNGLLNFFIAYNTNEAPMILQSIGSGDTTNGDIVWAQIYSIFHVGHIY